MANAFRVEALGAFKHCDVIWSLAKKPGAFARYRLREELFPTLVFGVRTMH